MRIGRNDGARGVQALDLVCIERPADGAQIVQVLLRPIAAAIQCRRPIRDRGQDSAQALKSRLHQFFAVVTSKPNGSPPSSR